MPKAIKRKEGTLNKSVRGETHKWLDLFILNISRDQSLITLCGYENQTDLIQSFYIKKDPPNWMLRVTEHHHVKY